MNKSATMRVEDIGLPMEAAYSILNQGVTQGLAADFATCRQRFLFRVNGWRLDNNDSDALYFGSLCHGMLEKFHGRASKFPGVMLKKWLAEYLKANPKPDSEEIYLKAEALLSVYFEVFKKDPEKHTPVRTEEVFSVTAMGANLRGRKDFVYKLKTDKKWMMEHKTKSRVDQEYLAMSLAFDIQNCFYDLSENLEHGSPFIGIQYNILRTPAFRLSEKKGETGPEFLARMKKEIRANHADYFFRYEVTFAPQDRARFKRELQAKLDEMKLYLKGKLAHYRNEAACQTPYRCNFLRACSSGFMTGYSKSKIIFPELEE